MDRIVEAASHFLYRCGTCQMDLHLGPLACISKGNLIFYEIDESSVHEESYGLLCAIFPSKMKVRCAKCRAKLGYSGRGLSFMDRAKFCYKFNCAALEVVVGGEAAIPPEAVERIPTGKSAVIPLEAAATEAKHEENAAFLPLSMREIKKRRLCLKCLKEGHNQSSCKEEPCCFRCGIAGHFASNCPKK